MPDEPGAQDFLAVLFPMEDMEIQAYNRVVRKLPAGKTKFLEQLRHRFDVEEALFAEPEEPGLVGVYLSEEVGWLSLALPETERDGVADTLDVARLSEFILEPMLGIRDARTDANIAFVGGIRGTEELERLVDSGEAEIAFCDVPDAARGPAGRLGRRRTHAAQVDVVRAQAALGPARPPLLTGPSRRRTGSGAVA